MNITHILPTSASERYYHTRYLYHGESKRGHKVNVITWDPTIRNRLITINNNFKVYILPGKNISPFRNFHNPIIKFDNYIRSFETDVMHAHILFKFTTLSSAIISSKQKVPLIVSIHGVIAPEGLPLEIAQRLYYYTVGKYLYKIASGIRCLTQSDATEMVRFGCNPEKIKVIPNGVDANKFRPERKSSDNTIYWGGRFVPQKDLFNLIKAIKIVSKQIDDINLVMSGDGPLFSKIVQFVNACKLRKNVTFKGRVPFLEIPKLLNSASMYVLPSVMEGMPYSLLEAMSCGKPVIASNIPGIKDVITQGENGILVPPRDPDKLAKSIVKLMENKDLRTRIGNNARKLIVNEYDWSIIAEKMEKLYVKTTENTIRR